MNSCSTLTGTDGGARTGEIRMPRGVIRTPAFMPVGTAGTVKAMLSRSGEGAQGADVPGARQYLSPDAAPGGAERVSNGSARLHAFMNWPYPILTDFRRPSR